MIFVSIAEGSAGGERRVKVSQQRQVPPQKTGELDVSQTMEKRHPKVKKRIIRETSVVVV